MYRRVACLAILLLLELAAISIWLDLSSLNPASPIARLMQYSGTWMLRAVVAFAPLFLLFGYLRGKGALREIGTRPITTPVSWILLASHFGALGLLGGLSHRLFGGHSPSSVQAVCWIACGLLAMVLAALALAPFGLWVETLRATGAAWIYAAVSAGVFSWLAAAGRALWPPATAATFAIVRVLLSLVMPRVVSDPATMSIGSPAFTVTVEPDCSGMEGVGLMLGFGLLWLCLFRREFRFPRALLLLPMGLAAVFLLNSVRIAVLILIGTAGAPAVAVSGFHSQAGWIAFNAVALGFCALAQRMPWIAAEPRKQVEAAASAENPAAWYLLPWLAILATAMLSRAAGSQFEWLYPLRFFAAAAVLWHFRKRYTGLNWRCGWLAPATGVLVSVVWIALGRLGGSAAGAPAPVPVSHGAAWIAWLVLRTLGAVVTVPLAEELAFRGYLMRRVAAADFEKVEFRSVSWLAVLLSSVVFGVLHGAMWLAGILAGIVYAGLLRRRGRMGDAAMAHATSNAVLAAWVITRGAWQLW